MATANSRRPQRRFSKDSEIRAAKPGTGSYELTDTQAKGLRLRVQPSGSKRFWYRYLGKDGKSHRLLIGEYGLNRVSLTEARAKRHELAAIRDDPTSPDPHEVIAEREREVAAKAADEARQAEKSQWTVKTVGEAWIAFLQAKRRPRTVTEYQRQLGIYVNPEFGDIPILDVTDDVVRAILAPIAADGHYRQRNSLRVALLGLFSWARDKERGTVRALHGMCNPVLDIRVIPKKDLPKGYGQTKEALSTAALKALWRRLQTDRDDYTDILALQLLTGCRITETTLARWRDIDLAHGQWVIPGKFTKNGRPHHVHLSPQAVDMLSSRPGERPGNVFSVRADIAAKKLSGYLKVAGIDASEYGSHSLRKSVATGVIQQLGYRQEIRRFILDQTPPDSLELTYVRAEWGAQAAKALDEWASYLDGLITGQVSELKRA